MSSARNSKSKYAFRLISTAIIANLGLTSVAHAALEEIIVTAQKREQSIQEVPVAITALTQESLETNRVQTVTDLSSLAPNLSTRPAAGGSQVASFTMRGVTSYGIAPGSDKEISIYLDGVYIGAPRGSIFNLPDIAQMEVLRGPQGTLFGRNATAGAINITTRDPSGQLGLRQDLSVGNHNYKRNRTTIDSPQWGPFSFLATYLNEERDGDIKNTEGGKVWDRTAIGRGTAIVPDRMGDKDSETYFLAAKFQPTDTFSMTYKVDHAVDHGTPAGSSLIWFNPALMNPATSYLVGGLNDPLAPSATLRAIPNLPTLNPDGRRPKSISDAFAIPVDQGNTGHSLTTLADVSDHWTIKNITAFRTSTITSAVDLEGLGQLRNEAFPTLPHLLTASQFTGQADQWSSELQSNYESDAYTLTLGALYYEGEERGGDKYSRGNFSGVFPGYVIPANRPSTSYNDSQSLAGYSQLEYHLTDTVDLLAGYRITRDRKSGDFISSSTSNIITHHPFTFAESKPSYMAGVNYKPTYDTLIYGKYSQAFVSGGSVGGYDFDSETAKSWEAGLKSDFFDSKLRSNLSVFYVDYYHVQSPQGGRNFGRSDLGVIVIDLGQVTAKGFEWEGSASVGYGVTLKASAGYTHTDIRGPIDPRLQASVALNPAAVTSNDKYLPTLQPDWTSNLGALYESDPIFGQSYLSFNLEGSWHSAIRMDANPNNSGNIPGLGQTEFSPASWVVNSRLALKKVDLGFAGVEGEVAIWGRNLTDNDYPIFEQSISGIGRSGQYLEARSYGVDFTAKF